MEQEKLEALNQRWEDMVGQALVMKEMSLNLMQALLRDTYAALFAYQKQDMVPAILLKIVWNIQDFLEFAGMIEEKELYENWFCRFDISSVVYALREGFFDGYAVAYPKLQLSEGWVIDMETDFLPIAIEEDNE